MRNRGFEAVPKEYLKVYNNCDQVILPVRGSKYSAGYDFITTKKLLLEPNNKDFFWTDIRAYMLEDEVLKLYIRSSLGIKNNLELSNIVGIIDCDYYNNKDTMGNIGISIRNKSNEIVTIEKNTRIVQGIFIKYLVSDNCNTSNIRIGGFGSTNG